MKKTLTYPFFLLLIFAGTACKKDNAEPSPVDPVITHSTLNMLVTATYQNIENNSLSIPTYESAAVFYADDDMTYVQINSLSLNGINIPYNGTYYESFDPISPPANHIWDIKGKNGIPDFSYTCQKVSPTYTGYASLPTSMDHTKELKITLTGLANAEEVSISLVVNNSASIGQQKRIVDNTASTLSVTFAADELMSLKPNDKITIQLICANYQMELIGERIFTFGNQASFDKKDIIVY